jgi:putative chitinase
MTITLALLKANYKTTPSEKLERLVDPLNKACAKFDISTVNRKAAFLAQVAHESGSFNFVQENLNYSADGLGKIFGKYFPTAALRTAYARKPEKIANRVYANRMGNGAEASGDGFRYRGRGLIQLTGKDNYSAFAKFMNMKLEDVVAYLETAEGAVMSAAWFWNSRGLNAYADRGDLAEMTRRINGGHNGLADRISHYNAIKKSL